MKKPKLAVSAIFHFEGQVYLIKRQNHLRSFPGYLSFPGGKVDKEDIHGDSEKDLERALRRELLEELEIDIHALENDRVVSKISKVGKATSPKFNPYIFETYFFLIELNHPLEFVEDRNEIFKSYWMRPEEVLQEFDKGRFLMIYPIRKMIENLVKGVECEYIDFDEGRNEEIPIIEPIKGFLQIMPDSNTLFPATKTNAFIIGDKNQVLIDPSPKNKDLCDKLIKTLKKYNIISILITHHHADHHEYAPQIAQALNIPIKISKDSFDRCGVRYGQDYFGNANIEIVKEGDIVSRWLGQDVSLYEIPGHDEGHLGVAPKNLAWFIVGDLFQGVGTVVVGGDEGNMIKYFESLKKVIKLSPKSVTPSHGITLGGVNILEKTLKHRELREEQILNLYQMGRTKEEILKTIYFEIPEQLHPYAMANIVSHLKKLEIEGKINP